MRINDIASRWPWMTGSLALLLTVSCSTAATESGQHAGAAASNGAQPALDAPATDALPKAPEAAPAKVVVPDLNGLLKASYRIVVRLDGKDGPLGLLNLLHADVCDGTLDLSLNPSLEALESGNISKMLVLGAAKPIYCQVIDSNVDFTKLLGPLFSVGANSGSPGLPVLKDGDVLGVTSLLGVTYVPPRPFFPSLLASKKESLTTLNRSIDSKATLDGKEYTGHFALTMQEFDTPYQPPGMKIAFPKSMRFVHKTSGFVGLDPLKGLLFDELAFRMSLAPLAITEIGVKGMADKLIPIIASVPEQALSGLLKFISPFIKGAVTSKGLDNTILIGITKDIAVTITVSLVSQEGLNEAGQADRGETFGNQAAPLPPKTGL